MRITIYYKKYFFENMTYQSVDSKKTSNMTHTIIKNNYYNREILLKSQENLISSCVKIHGRSLSAIFKFVWTRAQENPYYLRFPWLDEF